ncbi:hypothetical protein NQ314_014406 [Rhamnusium bicolor]|uniref:Thiamine pyrophosphokinase 1 n=1 Tax=Rhamnusium bicolor TaxID=1586634 RepID=A0AAV8X2S4_9CUCU|nr:hypothetical protein NQ314_014406 [Rhamnusium bicolor]
MSCIKIKKISKFISIAANVASNTLPNITDVQKTNFSVDMNNFEKIENWTPCDDLIVQCKNSNYAVVILNTPINFSTNQQFVVNLWNQAKVRVTVNGGTQRWFQWLKINGQEFQEILIPDIITGDMDSLPNHVLNYFQKSGTKVIVTPDQDETDYIKALRELNIYCNTENLGIDIVYVMVDTCGRFDQMMANINTLFKTKYIFQSVKIFQIASSSLTWLLPKGYNAISIPINLRKNQEWCSLIPIGAPCNVISTGLKWNLNNTKLEFGTLVSTSNTYDGSAVVTIQTDGPVIWSMSIATMI